MGGRDGPLDAVADDVLGVELVVALVADPVRNDEALVRRDVARQADEPLDVIGRRVRGQPEPTTCRRASAARALRNPSRAGAHRRPPGPTPRGRVRDLATARAIAVEVAIDGHSASVIRLTLEDK